MCRYLLTPNRIKTCIAFLAAAILAGCNSRCCHTKQEGEALEPIFARQIKEGSSDTLQNLRALGCYFAEDFRTAGPRMADTAGKFSRGMAEDRKMTKAIEIFGRQIRQGKENLPRTIELLGRCFCLCRD